MEITYFYEQAGQPAGPLAADQLLARGVTAATLVWREGLPGWVPAGSVPELQRFFQPIMPHPLSPVVPIRRTQPAAPVRKAGTGKKILTGLAVLGVLGVEWLSTGAESKQADATLTEVGQSEPEEIKEIGYAANHPEEVTADEPDESAREPAAESVEPDAIETIDNDHGWLTITYASGRTRGVPLGSEKDWFFAYSPQLIVVHDASRHCIVRDLNFRPIAQRTTLMGEDRCTGMRVVGERIVLDVDTGHSTHQELYDKHLNLVQKLSSHSY